MSVRDKYAEWPDDDEPCACGHARWLHDDGKNLCLDCDCVAFRAVPGLRG